MLWIFELFAFAGGAIIGVPIALFFPAQAVAVLSWPQSLLLGASLGPISLAMVLAAISAAQGRMRDFSLAHVDLGWVLSPLVSTVAFVVYAALVKRASQRTALVS